MLANTRPVMRSMAVPPLNRNHNPNKRHPDYNQNLTASSVAHVSMVSPIHQILWKLVDQFLYNPVSKQINKRTKMALSREHTSVKAADTANAKTVTIKQMLG